MIIKDVRELCIEICMLQNLDFEILKDKPLSVLIQILREERRKKERDQKINELRI